MNTDKKIQASEKVLPDLMKSLEKCALCARNCKVNRLKGEKGFCKAGKDAIVYSYAPHHGEEPPLSGTRGSGTIFFSRCSMRCVYCQNHEFSQSSAGKTVSPKELAGIMLSLEKEGCHNINLVTPTHFTPAIIEALKYAWEKGLKLPIVYNTGGYDSLSVIRSLKGLIDIYLPDMRYARDQAAEKYSQAPGYVHNNRRVVKEMNRQVGRLKLSSNVALKGLIIRLLILPNRVSGTPDTLAFIAREIGTGTYLSVMSQYYPAYKAKGFKELSRRINRDEYNEVMDKLRELCLDTGWIQPFEGEFDERFAGENLPPNY